MQVTIPIHSVVDVITNSSSVIYTQAAASAATVARKIVNEILAVAGVQGKTADDLFNFDIQIMPDDLQEWLNYYAETDDPGFPNGKALQEARELGTGSYQERNQRVQDWLDVNRPAVLEFLNDRGASDWDDYPRLVPNLVITTKSGSEIELSKSVLRMFSIEASYNG